MFYRRPNLVRPKANHYGFINCPAVIGGCVIIMFCAFFLILAVLWALQCP